MSFSGTVERESHEGGLLVAFEGRAPRLGATLRIIGGKPIGKVNSVIGAVDRALIHIHPIPEEIESSNAIGSPVEIAPRERWKNQGRGRDRERRSPRDDRRNDRRGRQDGNKGEDWTCPKCKNSKFAFRKKCHRCEAVRPRGGGGRNERNSNGRGNTGQKAGDWDCPKCKNSNFAFRKKCHRCEAYRPWGGGGRNERNSNGLGTTGQKAGDWTCPKCKNSNFAFRDKCNKCKADKPSSDAKSRTKSGFGGRNSRSQVGRSERGRGRAPGSASRPHRSGFRGTGRGGPRSNRPGRGSGRR